MLGPQRREGALRLRRHTPGVLNRTLERPVRGESAEEGKPNERPRIERLADGVKWTEFVSQFDAYSGKSRAYVAEWPVLDENIRN